MNAMFSDYGAWMNLLKANYRKGEGTLRGILADPVAAGQLVIDRAAVMAIYGDVDYGDGSCLCAEAIGVTDYAPPAFNLYLQIRGLTTHATWEATKADLETLGQVAADPAARQILYHSPGLEAASQGLEMDSWATIKTLGMNGLAKVYYQVGDTKDIVMTGNFGTMTLELADFDHDFLSNSTDADKAPMTFLTKNLLEEVYQMNTTNTNVGGYPSAALRSTLEGNILGKLPVELRNVMRTIYKWYGTGNQTTDGQWLSSSIFIPMEREVYQNRVFSPSTEANNGARQYPIFSDNASRVKRLNNGAGNANSYWLASPVSTSDKQFCSVNDTGGMNNSNASGSFGVCFGLAV